MRPEFSLKSYILNGNLELAYTLGKLEEWGGEEGDFNLPLRSLARSPDLGRESSPMADSMRNNPPASAEGMVAMAIW